MRVLLLGLFLLASSCRSAPAILPLREVVPDGTADFALDPIPVPRDAELSDHVAILGSVSVVHPEDVDCMLVLEEVFPGEELRRPPETADTLIRVQSAGDSAAESFQISIVCEADRVEVLISAADAAGRRFAAETLRQLICVQGGTRFIRLGTIRDRPGFPLRGNKRPRSFERRYRANLSWENPGHEIFVPVWSPGGVLDATAGGLQRVRGFFLAGHEAGARRFAIEFDDVGFDLTPETRDLHGSYFFALCAYLRESREMLRAIDSGAVLYWLPQTYWTRAAEFPRFAGEIGRAGGVPADLGLVLTGPEVISSEIPAGEIGQARRRLGLTVTKAVIYDNLGREGDHGPLRGRGPDLLHEVDGVFGERGEVLNRITRLDYSWNPSAYDPERSHLLACREVVGAAAAPYLHQLVLEIDELSAADALRLLERVELEMPARAGGPVEREKYLRDLRGWLLKRLNIDPSLKSP